VADSGWIVDLKNGDEFFFHAEPRDSAQKGGISGVSTTFRLSHERAGQSRDTFVVWSSVLSVQLEYPRIWGRFFCELDGSAGMKCKIPLNGAGHSVLAATSTIFCT
jgi:hypothetical protein